MADKNFSVKNTEFRKTALLVGLNEFSGTMSFTVVPIIFITLYGSYTLASTSVFIYTSLGIISQVSSGAIVDRFGATIVLRICSITLAVLWVLFALLALAQNLNHYLALALIGAVGFCSSFDYPAEQQVIKRATAEENLGKAATVIQVRESFAATAAPPLGGFLVSLAGLGAVLVQGLLNFLSFLVSLFLKKIGGTDTRKENSFIDNLKNGYRVVLTDRPLTIFALVAGIANITVTGIPLTLIYHYSSLGRNEFELGLVNAFFGLGIILGGFILPLFLKRLRIGTLGTLALGMMAVGNVLMIFSNPDLYLTMAVIVASLLFLPAFNASLMIYTNLASPSELIGSVSSAMGIPGMILMPVGSLLSGILYSRYGAGPTLAVFSAFSLLSFALLALSKEVRSLGYAPQD